MVMSEEIAGWRRWWITLRVGSRRDPLLLATGGCYEVIGLGFPAVEGVVWGLERETSHPRSLEPSLPAAAIWRIEVGSGFHISDTTRVGLPRTSQ